MWMWWALSVSAVETFRRVTLTDSQSLGSAHHQRVVWHISLVAHSMDKYIMSRAKGHDTATLHTSCPCRLCCITGLALGIVSASSSEFLVVRFSSASSAWSVLPCSTCAAAMGAFGGPHILLFERTSCWWITQHSFRWDWHLTLFWLVARYSTCSVLEGSVENHSRAWHVSHVFLVPLFP